MEGGVAVIQLVNVSYHIIMLIFDYSPSVSVTVVNCGFLTNPSNGAVSTSSGTTFNQVATYSCDSGYMISGAATRTCQITGWSLAPPTCPRESR